MLADTKLQAGGMGLWGAVTQAVTHIAPSFGLLTGATFIASQSGISISLTYFIAFLICMSIGLSIVQLARHLPSAGGYFTYVSRTLSPRFGFITAWLFFLYDPTVAAINFTILGFILQHQLSQRLGWNLPWQVVALVGILFVTFFVYRGIKISAKTMMILASIEILILLAFSLSGIISSGPGGVNLLPFVPDKKFGIGGIALGVVFAIFAFTGFEAVAPMAEETTNPRRNLPLAIVISLCLMGGFYVFASYGLTIGWGTSTFDSTFAGQSFGVFLNLGQRLWGDGQYLLLLALINSAFAVGMASTNATTRVFYSMGRAGALPKWFDDVHPKYKTPRHAIIFATVLTLLVAYIGGFWIGPDQIYFFLGLVITFGLIGVYGLGNIGVVKYYRTEMRAEFNWFWHLIIPLISTAAIIAVGYESLQGLSGLFFWTPWVVVGWIVVGVVVLQVMRLRGKEEWLLKAGVVAYEHQATPEELTG
jgi:amino acid transporter